MLQKTVEIVELKNRIALANARIVPAADDLPRHVAFDVVVDGKEVCNTLEWLDKDYDLVSQDCHLDVNQDYIDAVADALGSDWESYNDMSDDARCGARSDVAEVVHTKLRDIVVELIETYPPAVVDRKYGEPRRVPLSSVCAAVLRDIGVDAETAEAPDADLAREGVEAWEVNTFGRDGFIDGSRIVVIVTGLGNDGAWVTWDGEPDWFEDATTVQEALVRYEGGAA